MALGAIRRGRHHLVQGTPESSVTWPILWRARVTSGRRNARKGVGGSSRGPLKVRANPMGQPCLRDKTRQVKARRGEQIFFAPLVYCCDALRCSGPHARYTDRANEFFTLAERSGQ